MRVTIEQNLHVLEFESELRVISLDLWRRFDKSTIEQDVAFRCRDKKRSNFRRADIIKISDDLEWRYRLVPTPAGGISLSKCHRDSEKTEGKRDVDFCHARAYRVRSRMTN